ncbi:MAG: hypothetical protein D6160_08920 [Ketobacter sp.]|nr:MAG: hypothetical protein D6160_08920 [Ketobacter sp.]
MVRYRLCKLKFGLLIGALLVVPSAMAANPALYYGAPRCGANNQVVVAFKSGAGYSQLNTVTTNNVANYSVSGHTVTSAVFSTSANSTVLTLNSTLGNLTKYTVNVANIQDQNGSGISASSDTFFYSTTESGLVGELYNRKDYSGDVTIKVDPVIDETYNGGFLCIFFPGLCGTDVSARWKGFLLPAESGNFVFETETNDGSRLWVGDLSASIINYWGADGSNAVTRTSAAKSLTQGVYYPIVQDFYYDRQGFIFYDTGSIVLRWDPPSQSKRTIPSSALSTCVAVDDTPVLDHFEITVPASASACGTALVTITAIDSSGNPITDYTGTITLGMTSSAGDWSVSSGAGSLNNGTAGDGAASYTYAAADNGVVTLSLDHARVGSAQVTVNASAESISNTSTAIQFLNAGITIRNESASGWDVIAGRDHDLSVAYLLFNEAKEECEPEDFDAQIDLKFWVTPTASLSPPAVVPALSGSAGYSPLSSDGTNPTTLSVDVTGGVGALNLRTSDVGDFNLHVLDDVSDFAVSSPGAQIEGEQDKGAPITVRPFGLYVVAQGNDWHNQFESSGLSAANADGPAYVKAGDPFSVSVSGMLYDAADDSDGNGVPDGFADTDPSTLANLSDNGVTQSFGQENVVVNVTAQLITPVSGNPGILSAGPGPFSGGISTGTYRYSEVGIIELKAASDASYLNSGVALLGASGYVGRFIPHHFDVTSNTVNLTDGWLDSDGDNINDWDCDFTYFGQSFGLDTPPQLTFTARNRDNVVTQNYAGTFNKFSAVSGTFVDNGLPLASGSALSTPATPVMSVTDDVVPGQFIQTVSGYSEAPYAIRYSKPLQPGAGEIPFDADLDLVFPDDSGNNLTDLDGVCYEVDTNGDGVTDSCRPFTLSGIGGTRILYGRLNIDNNFGPEINTLILPLRSEYWQLSGGMYGFYVNGADNVAATSPGACTGTTGITVGLQYYPARKGNLEGNTAPALDGLVDGLGRVVFSAPGVGNSGQVNVNLLGPDFMQFDFNGDGVAEAAGATATFGIYGGKNSPVIYKRESYR